MSGAISVVRIILPPQRAPSQYMQSPESINREKPANWPRSLPMPAISDSLRDSCSRRAKTRQPRRVPRLRDDPNTKDLFALPDSGRRRRRCCRCGSRLLVRFADIDSALEERAVFDADASRGHIAGQGAFGADVHAIAGGDVAPHLAKDHHFARGDAGGHLAVAAHGHAISVQVDAALDFAVDEQRFRAGDFTLDR